MSPRTTTPHSAAISATCVVFPPYQTQVPCSISNVCFQRGGNRNRGPRRWRKVSGGGGGFGIRGLEYGVRTETEELEEEPALSARALAACTAYPSTSTYIILWENMGITTKFMQYGG